MAQKKIVRKKAAAASSKTSAKKPASKIGKKSGKVWSKAKPTKPAKKGAGKKPDKQGKVSRKATGKKAPNTKPKSDKNLSSAKKAIRAKKDRTSAPGKTRKTPFAGSSAKSSLPSSPGLTGTERYNLGGLFACAIQKETDPDFKRLRAILRELELTSLEKDNLIRLSQGFTVPKLFSDGISLEKVGQVVERLVKFAVGEGAYARKWKQDIHQVAAWLGVPVAEVEAVEVRITSKQ